MPPFTGQFTLPRLERVIAGPGTLAALPAELDRYGCSRAIVVTGRTLGVSPLLGRLTTLLGRRCHAVITNARQHVPASTVEALVAAVKDAGADCLVSFGGGSPIDTAKAAVHALLAGEGAGGGTLTHVAIPTTLSAGEFTDVAGVTDERTRIKHAVADVRIAPRSVIADPELALDTPDWLWAASGIRALDHAVESLYSRRHHPISDALAPRAIEMLVAHLEPSVRGAEDERLAHRGECQMAAWLAVFGVTNAGFGLSHVLGHQIGPRWGVAHGLTSAIMLPHAMRFMAERAPVRFAYVASGFGIPFDAANPHAAARACAERAARYVAGFGLPARLRDVEVPQHELPEIAAHVCRVMEREAPLDEPVTAAALGALLAAAY
jgi:alcohol dehydrogenase class IV